MEVQVEVTICCNEIYQLLEISDQDLAEMVSHGIIAPHDPHAEEWYFSESVVAVISRASRLRDDLQIDWAGLALALDLLDQIDALKRENDSLRRRLSRLGE